MPDDTPKPDPSEGTSPQPGDQSAQAQPEKSSQPELSDDLFPDEDEPIKTGLTRALQRRNITSAQELKEEIHRMTLINQAARHFITALDLTELKTAIFNEVLDTLDAEAGSFWLVEGAEVVCHVAEGPDTSEVIGMKLKLGTGIVGWCAHKGEATIVYDTKKDRRFSKLADRKSGFETKSMISVPMMHNDQVLGVIQVINKKSASAQFSDHDLEMMKDIAAFAAISINNARLYESQRRAEVFATLMSVSRELTSSLDVDSILVTIVNGTHQVVPYERAAFALESNGKAQLSAISGMAKIDTADPKTKATQDALEFLLSRNRDEWVADVDAVIEEDTYPSQLLDYFRSSGCKAFWAKILKDEEGVLGIFMLESFEKDFISNLQQEVLEILCSQATVAVRNAQLYSKVPLKQMFGGTFGEKGWWTGLSKPKKIIVASLAVILAMILFVFPTPTSVGGEFEVEPSRIIPMYPKIDGTVERVFVKDGQKVKKDQLLVVFDANDLKLQLSTKLAQLEQVRMELASPELSNDELADVTLRHQLLQREIDKLNADIANMTIRAPFDGTIMGAELKNMKGKRLETDDEICSLEDLSEVEIKVFVDERDVRFVMNQPPEERHTSFKSAAFRSSFAGTVASLSPTAEEREGATVFVAKVPLVNKPGMIDEGDPSKVLLKGMTGHAEIEVESRRLFMRFLHWMGLN